MTYKHFITKTVRCQFSPDIYSCLRAGLLIMTQHNGGTV